MAALAFIGLFWVLPYLVGLKLCPAKERSLWWPILLGWLGVLIILAMPAGGKKCPACAETVRSAAQLCRHCGHSFA